MECPDRANGPRRRARLGLLICPILLALAARAAAVDCNGNGIDDTLDRDSGFSRGCNENGIPDACDVAPSASIFV